VLGSEETAARYESLLLLLSGGGFPKPGKRDNLTPGEKHLSTGCDEPLRARTRASRDFRERRYEGDWSCRLGRTRLAKEFGIGAMTVDEFKAFCKSLRRGREEANGGE
jgi:hypothetical protein